jgi:hypothetical protein
MYSKVSKARSVNSGNDIVLPFYLELGAKSNPKFFVHSTCRDYLRTSHVWQYDILISNVSRAAAVVVLVVVVHGW